MLILMLVTAISGIVGVLAGYWGFTPENAFALSFATILAGMMYFIPTLIRGRQSKHEPPSPEKTRLP
jgi:zinc transporter ZupT